MSLKTYHNIKDHFDNIDASIFSGDLLYDADAVTEIEAYLKRWAKAINEHKECMMEQAEEDEAEYDAQRKIEIEKANCDYSVYNKTDGTTTYNRFLQSLPMFNSSPKQMQESAEYMIAGWNHQSPNLVYTLERMWWNGER